EQAVVVDPDKGGVKHSFQSIIFIQRFCHGDHMVIAFRRSPDDHLSALSRRDKGSVSPVCHDLMLSSLDPPLDLPHRRKDLFPGLSRSEKAKPLRSRKL